MDQIRRVADQDKARLFLRAVPSVEYLILLSEAGQLSARGKRQTSCVITNDGELKCDGDGSNSHDCRLVACRYAELMRMRLLVRLGRAYAHERNKLGVR